MDKDTLSRCNAVQAKIDRLKDDFKLFFEYKSQDVDGVSITTQSTRVNIASTSHSRVYQLSDGRRAMLQMVQDLMVSATKDLVMKELAALEQELADL